MTGRSDFMRNTKYWCKIHRRYFPSGRDACLLCELAVGDQLDELAAERRRRLVDVFPKRDLGGQAAVVRVEERRVLRRQLSVRKYSKTSLLAKDPIREPVDRF